MVREELIESAVSFLQDPSVANAPLDKRIAFLQSKNLTQEEIDISISRTGGDSGYSSPAPSTPSQPPSYGYRQPPPPPAQYGQFQGYWQQPPPPEPPRRDWRDYFIMATVMGGVGYGLYWTAKRYIYPLIAPPTPPQLEQDKAAVDEAFNRAFALIEQLNTDTQALKKSEEARTERLDTALGEMEGVITSLKDSSKRRDDDSRRIEDDVRSLRDLIPKALDAQREITANQLKDLSQELKGLKTLVANRVSPNSAPAPVRGGPSSSSSSSNTTQQPSAPKPAAKPVQPPNGTTNGTAPPALPSVSTDTQAPSVEAAAASSATSASTPASEKAAAANSFTSRFGQGRSIPAWQLAAQKKDTAESETATPVTSEAQ